MSRRDRLALIGFLLAAVAGLCSGVAMIGQPAKLSGVITVFFTGVASGVSIAMFAFEHRLKRLGFSPGQPGAGQATAADEVGRPEPR